MTTQNTEQSLKVAREAQNKWIAEGKPSTESSFVQGYLAALSYQSSGEAKEPVAVSDEWIYNTVGKHACRVPSGSVSVTQSLMVDAVKEVLHLLANQAVPAQPAPASEREAFEKWLASGEGHKGIWNAWQARAAVGQPPAVPHGEPNENRAFVGQCRSDCHAKLSAGFGICHTSFCPVRDAAPVVPTTWTAEKERIYNEGYQDGKELAPHKFAAPVVPEGWKLVPLEPTEEMRKAALADSCWANMNPPPTVAYRAMLSAAPVAQSVPDTAQPQDNTPQPVMDKLLASADPDNDPLMQTAQPQEAGQDEPAKYQEWLHATNNENPFPFDAWMARAAQAAPAVPDTAGKDSERYRWLKTVGWQHGVPNFAGHEPVFKIEFDSPNYGWNRGDDNIDAAIDAAMSQEEQRSEG